MCCDSPFSDLLTCLYLFLRLHSGMLESCTVSLPPPLPQRPAPASAPRFRWLDMAAEAATVQDEQDYRQKQQAATGSSSLGSGSSSSDGGSSAAELLAGRRRALAAEWAALRAANSLVPYDVPYPPGQGLGIVVPGWRLLANVLGRVRWAGLGEGGLSR